MSFHECVYPSICSSVCPSSRPYKMIGRPQRTSAGLKETQRFSGSLRMLEKDFGKGETLEALEKMDELRKRMNRKYQLSYSEKLHSVKCTVYSEKVYSRARISLTITGPGLSFTLWMMNYELVGWLPTKIKKEDFHDNAPCCLSHARDARYVVLCRGKERILHERNVVWIISRSASPACFDHVTDSDWVAGPYPSPCFALTASLPTPVNAALPTFFPLPGCACWLRFAFPLWLQRSASLVYMTRFSRALRKVWQQGSFLKVGINQIFVANIPQYH